MPRAKRFERYWEVDSLRGVAIVMMLLSNLIFDLAFFRIAAIDAFSGFWWWFARTTAGLFILIAGVSVTLSSSRAKKSHRKIFSRGAKIFGLGLLITAATFVLFRDNLILFGVLHLIGLAIMLSPLLMRLKIANLVLGCGIIAAGVYLMGLSFQSPWLLWLGLQPANYVALDYVPLFPWLGVFLVGMVIGNSFYSRGKRQFRLKDISKSAPICGLVFLGRNSLKIYLLHQPVIVGLLYLIFLR